MKNRHLSGIKDAITRGEGEVAHQLEVIGDESTGVGSDVEFIDTTAAFRDWAKKCVVVDKAPESVVRTDETREAEYVDYLVREARRQGAIFYHPEERADYIVVRFLDNPEEMYSVSAFERSMRRLIQKAKEESLK
ncbi:MAG: hypothetical protein WC817_01845 [Patescibacteria group bacterium]|jgi:hypothetical protein